MEKREAVGILYGLIADVNAEEIADHIKTESLQDWSDTWRCRAKEVLMVLEDEPSNSEKPNNYCDDCLYTDTCDSKEFFYACTSKATISKMEQVEEPQMGDAKPIPLSNRVTHIKDEPQTDCAWK